MDKMFEPLTEQEKATQAKPDNSKDKGIAIIPVPYDVELIIPPHFLGTPHIVWDYRDKNGHLLLGIVALSFHKLTAQRKRRPPPVLSSICEWTDALGLGWIR